MTGDINSFANEEEARHRARFHRTGVEIGCIDTPGCHFGFRESFGPRGMKLPVMQTPFTGIESCTGPSGRRAGIGELIGQPLRHNVSQSLPECRRIAACARRAQRGKNLSVRRKIDDQGFAGLPVRRSLQDGGAAEAAMGEEEFFAEFCMTGLRNDLC